MNGQVRIGVLGCGNVGSAFVGLVAERAKEIEARTGIHLEVVRVAVRNLSRSRDVEIDPALLTNDAADGRRPTPTSTSSSRSSAASSLPAS